jgi:hypothetical protein
MRLESVRHFADSDRDVEVRQFVLGCLYLGSEFFGTQDTIEEGLGTKLNDAGDEFGFGIGV